jgi:hypothetical protein
MYVVVGGCGNGGLGDNNKGLGTEEKIARRSQPRHLC